MPINLTKFQKMNQRIRKRDTEMLDSSDREESSPNGSMPKKGNLSQDAISIGVLLILYTLQGIPMGLSGSIPLIMKERGVSYEELSYFSLVSLPFSLKLIWAPIVDSYYSNSFGRRKSWLIPVQLCTGLIMILGSNMLNKWIAEKAINVAMLTGFFFLLYFLMATQDIAVDGWALTMLSRENVGLASVCNTVGQILGVLIANQGFVALSDAKWCEKFLGLRGGEVLITLPQFMNFWGYVFVIVTVGIWIFKKEEEAGSDEQPESLQQTCNHIATTLRLPPVRILILILLTCRVPFAPSDAIFTFKLQDSGMPKADIATISPILLLISLFLPALVSKLVTSRPMDAVKIGIAVKMGTAVLQWRLLDFTRNAYADGKSPGYAFFGVMAAVLVVDSVGGNLIFLSFISFFSKVSDPSIGGTYMTMLNTMCNFGSKWPNFLSLYLLPKLTYSHCMGILTGQRLAYDCVSDKHSCSDNGGVCHLQIDGYAVETMVCFAYGVVWLYLAYGQFDLLQGIPQSDWMVTDRAKFK